MIQQKHPQNNSVNIICNWLKLFTRLATFLYTVVWYTRSMHKKVVIVLPAYNAAKTLERTVNDIPEGSYDEIVLVDDASQDSTAELARSLGIHTIVHPKNRGYGGNQKTCYTHALEQGADIVVMLHPDYQYDPTVVPTITEPLRKGEADMVMASRFLSKDPRAQGMPRYKYLGNRLLTMLENWVFNQNLSEYHSGYRAYTRSLLKEVGFEKFSDNFVFDSQMMASVAGRKLRIAEISIPTRYFEEASQTSLKQSIRYGLATLGVLFRYLTGKYKK